MRLAIALATLMHAAAGIAGAVLAQTCTKGDFAQAVDRIGSSLRGYNAESAPRLQSGMRQLKDLKGWSEAETEEKSYDLLHDSRIEELDRRANELLARVDRLGADVSAAGPDCAALTELEAAGLELLATMKAKTTLMLARLDAAVARPPTPPARSDLPDPKRPPAVTPKEPAATSPPPRSPATAASPKVQPTPSAPSAAVQPTPPVPWNTTITGSQRAEPPQVDSKMEGGTSAIAPGLPPAAPEGFTIDEIRAASRGFFGTLSTGLASVIEHAFAKSGRPTAYVLGSEGGGAFLAGLRYGSGQLYLRTGETSRIYWHGPSIGYDFGAAGSKTMFLIYNLQQPTALLSNFTGIDGSAYLVGGVGITFLTNGQVTMAPIRTGLGLRLGASIGYIRFTQRPTWNPF